MKKNLDCNLEHSQRIITFTSITIPFLSFYSLIHLSLGFIELAALQAFSVMLLCLLFYSIKKSLTHLTNLTHALLTIALFTLTAVMILPSIANTGLYWMPLFPMLALFFVGSRKGIWWSAVWLGVMGIISILIYIGILPKIYTWESGGAAITETLFLNCFVYFYVRERERVENRAIQNEQKYRSLFDHLPDAVILSNQHGIFDCNQAALEIFACKHKDQLIHLQPKFSALENKDFTRQASKQQHFESIQKRLDAKTFPADIKLTQLQLQGEPCLQAIIRDISELKDNAQDLLNQKKKAEAANRAKSDFLSVMSHELRTPLHGIIGLLDLLESERKSISQEQQENLTLARFSAHNLRTLINDILDFTKADSGHLQLKKEQCQLTELLHHICIVFLPLCKEKDLKLYIHLEQLPEFCQLDSRYLRQVLMNLIGNAIKFTAKGHISINVYSHDQQLYFAIKDTGIGMQQAFISKVFEPFHQEQHSQQQHYTGTGLGTAIAQRFVILLGGEIEVSSQKGKGSCFKFHIPCESPSSHIINQHTEINQLTKTLMPSPKQEIQANTNNQPISILLAEDDHIAQHIAIKKLKKAGFDIDAVENGELAWQQLQRKSYQILLTDLRMPNLDGIALTRRIRAAELSQHQTRLIIIGLSAHALDDVAQTCMDAGMDDFITKPIDPDTILQHIKIITKLCIQDM